MWAKRIMAATLASACGIEAVRAAELTGQEPFSRTSDHARLVTAFGTENVAWQTIHGPEGTTFKESVVFPKDPARRIEVVWWDEKAPEAALLKVSSGSEFTSSDASIMAVKPKVREFGIGYPQR
jgi:uncharacterized protein (DUF1684 family)